MSNIKYPIKFALNRALKPINKFAYFVGPNPPTSFNPHSVIPKIHPSSFIGPFSSIIGDVAIKENVFIAPNVSVRADEGTPFLIGPNSNLQDGVILHGLKEGRVVVNGKQYSIFIGKRVTCAHGALVHGPCLIKDDVFIGFNAIVFNAVIGEGAYISPNAVVTGGIKIASNKFVPISAVIDTQAKADALKPVPESQHEFVKEVQEVNIEFAYSYSLFFGSARCSCGLCCNPEELHQLNY